MNRGTKRRSILPILIAAMGCALGTTQAEDAGNAKAPDGSASVLASYGRGPSIPVEDDAAVASTAAIEPIDLPSALARALQDNLDLALARANEAVADHRASGGRNALFPAVQTDLGFSLVDGTVQGSFGDFRDIDARGHRLGVGLTYGLNIGEQIKEAAALRRELDAAVFNRLAVEQRIILRVVEIFETLVLSKVGVNIANHLVADAETFARIARTREEAGIGLGADVARAEASLAASRSRLEEVREIWRQQSVRLAVVLRKDPAILLDPVDIKLASWRVADTYGEETAEAAAKNRPDIEAARQEAEAASRRVQAARWDLFGPSLVARAGISAVGGHGERSLPDRGDALSNAAGAFSRAANSWNNAAAGNAPLGTALGSFGRAYYDYRDAFRDVDQEIGLEGRTDLSIGLVWSLSLGKRDRLREMTARSEGARLRVEQLEDLAEGEVRSAYSATESASRRIAFAADELRAAEDNHRIALERFRGGTAIALEVLDAQQLVAQARLNLARHVVDHNLAQARLLAAAGIIAAEDFRNLESK